VTRLRFRDHEYETQGRSVLDCLVANGHDIPHACRAGVCQGCLMRAARGAVPARAQSGLRDTLVEQGYFLACQCHPEEPLEASLEGAGAQRFCARVLARRQLAPGILGLEIARPPGFDYRGGQYLRIVRDAGTARNYSLASVPGLDESLHLHVRAVPGGAVSGWLHGEVGPGDEIVISGAQGECYYTPGSPGQDLLLLATGTGLAPLWAIARDALRAGHRGRIHLYHGSRDESGQYLRSELERLQERAAQFRYHPCLAPSREPAQGVAQVALRDTGSLAGWRVFLCGSPRMVEEARIECFLAGAASGEILADAFLPYEAAAPDRHPRQPELVPATGPD